MRNVATCVDALDGNTNSGAGIALISIYDNPSLTIDLSRNDSSHVLPWYDVVIITLELNKREYLELMICEIKYYGMF